MYSPSAPRRPYFTDTYGNLLLLRRILQKPTTTHFFSFSCRCSAFPFGTEEAQPGLFALFHKRVVICFSSSVDPFSQPIELWIEHRVALSDSSHKRRTTITVFLGPDFGMSNDRRLEPATRGHFFHGVTDSVSFLHPSSSISLVSEVSLSSIDPFRWPFPFSLNRKNCKRKAN